MATVKEVDTAMQANTNDWGVQSNSSSDSQSLICRNEELLKQVGTMEEKS